MLLPSVYWQWDACILGFNYACTRNLPYHAGIMLDSYYIKNYAGTIDLGLVKLQHAVFKNACCNLTRLSSVVVSTILTYNDIVGNSHIA